MILAFIDDTFAVTQHHKEIKDNCDRVSNVKQFIDLYSGKDIGYPASINKYNYTLFAMNNFLKML